MKKILFAIAIVMMLGVTANAQKGRDTFFNWSDGVDYRGSGDALDNFPVLPGLAQDPNQDVPAPLGSGLLIMTALGAGYVAVRKKRR